MWSFLRRCALSVCVQAALAVPLGCGAQPTGTAYGADTAMQPASSSAVAVAELRVGIERLAKLRFQRDLLDETDRVRRQQLRERERVLAAAQVLLADKALPAVHRGRLGRLAENLGDYVEQCLDGAAGPDLYRDSESLVARLTFVSTAIASRDGEGLGTLIDLVTRAAATAQRVGKIDLARSGGLRSPSLDVDSAQALVEFGSALDAIGGQRLDERTRQELTLARHQWILLRPTLISGTALPEPARRRQLASTTDRIAESLLELARRAARAPVAANGSRGG